MNDGQIRTANRMATAAGESRPMPSSAPIQADYLPEDDAGLDPGIRDAVVALRRGGVETFESCQGGAGHAYPEPTIRFFGGQPEG